MSESEGVNRFEVSLGGDFRDAIAPPPAKVLKKDATLFPPTPRPENVRSLCQTGDRDI
ncbi:MAG: hypothetical protein ACP5D7_24860 [Limnospira sp.]